MKKLISAITLICIIITLFSACSVVPESDETTTAKTDNYIEGTMALAYNSADSLNPYTCKTEENLNITGLIFEPLFAMGSDFTASPVLTKSYKVNNLLVEVTLKDKIKFSDKSALTATDVVNSFNMAKESEKYSEALSNFTTATVYDTDTVIFTMEKNKINPISCLDFPIVKQSGENLIGTGNYLLKDGKLVANANAATYESVRNKTIELKELPRDEGLYYSVEVGAISAYYDDLSHGEVTSVSAQSLSVPTNNLIYIGFNGEEEQKFADKEVRKAVSLAIDRENIVKSCFSMQAVATALPFNPLWAEATTQDESTLVSNIKKAEEILTKAGYKKNYLGTYYKDENVLEIKLAVPDNNGFKISLADYIKTELAKISISVTVEKMPSEEFIKAIEENNFDMYIGEIRQTNDMSLAPFFTEGKLTSAGVEKESLVADAYSGYDSGTKTADDFIKVYNSEMPFVSICYRKGILYYTRELSDNVNGTYKNVYSNIYSWHFNKSY